MNMDNTKPGGPAAPGPAGPLLIQPGQVPALRMERMADLQGRVGLKKSQLFQLIKDGEFPKPVKVGRASLFVSAEVDAWLSERIRQARGGAA